MQEKQAEDVLIEQELPKELPQVVAIDQLANEFAKYELPEAFKEMFAATGKTPFGTLKFTKFTKLVFFLQQNKVGNAAMDYYSGLAPQRADNEDYESYRNRRKFAQTLLKFRPVIYNYPPGSGQGYMFKWEK